jgi:hypothetical protein
MEPSPGDSAQQALQSIDQIQQLLRAKDDTSRFVGLALLKSTLDNSKEFQNDKDVIVSLWACISPKFLDRLLRTGSGSGSGSRRKDAKDMLDLAVAVIHTFSLLLPEDAKSDRKLLGRVPKLVDALIQRFVIIPSSNDEHTADITSSSEETTQLILQTLLTLVSSSLEGAQAVAEIEDWSPLIEIAPNLQYVLDILAWSWIRSSSPQSENQDAFRTRIDEAFTALVASYKGTDAVTLLDFTAKILGRLHEDVSIIHP